jgi:hypothetical protein
MAVEVERIEYLAVQMGCCWLGEVLPSSALGVFSHVVDVDAVLKWHLLNVLHCSLKRS